MPSRPVEIGAGEPSDHAPHKEIELKLAGEPKALQSLFASAALRSRSVGRARSRQLDAIYYDTADLRLRREGLAFRVRRNGRRFEQTLKADRPGGAALERGEWEAQLSSAVPDLAAMPDGAGDKLAELLGAQDLRPVFSTRVRRQIRRLSTSDGAGAPSVVEAALDLGAIEAQGRSLPLAELELELIEGSPAALFRLARELDRLTPLHVETSSKAARGYALAAGEAPAWHKATPLALAQDASVDAALEAILRACLHHWTANEAAALDGRDPEGVHQLRVAIRRLRSAFSLFGKVIAPEELAWLKPEAKRIVTGLGPARDWDVFLAELLTPVGEARPDDPDLAMLRGVAEDARADGYAQARAAIRDPGYTSFVLRLGEWVETRAWRGEAAGGGDASHLEEPAVELAARLLAHRQRKVRKRGRAFASLSAADRHRLRIALKKLRYAAEFFAPLYPRKRTDRYVAALKRLQDDLGQLNDLAVAERLLDGLLGRCAADQRREALQRAAGLVLGWHVHAARVLEAKTAKKWAAFLEQKPFWT